MKFRNSAFIVLFLSALSIAWTTPMAPFPLVYKQNNMPLPLRALILKRVLFVRAFTAGFYFPDGESAEKFLDDVPKRLEVVFFVHVPHENLAGYARGKIWDNVTQKEFDQLQDRLKRMAEYLVEIKPGDRYVLVYTPKVGTRFELNGKLMGTIEGDDFARGLFSIWVGKHPIDKILKHQILQKFKERKDKN